MYIKFSCNLNGIMIYDIIENIIIGSVEYNKEEDYIENIYIDPMYRGKGYLRKILKYFPTATVLPLPQHVDKFKHLGYEICKIEGDDIYYGLAASKPAITCL